MEPQRFRRVRSQLERKVLGEPPRIALNRLIEFFRPDAIQLGQVSVQHDAVAARQIDALLDGYSLDRKSHTLYTNEGRQNSLAKEVGCTPAQLTLAWVLAQGRDIVPIPGTKHVLYLEENLGALRATPTADQLHRLGEALPLGMTAGPRYHAQGMTTINL